MLRVFRALALTALLIKGLAATSQTPFYIEPWETNPAYTVAQDSHLVVFDPGVAHHGHLLLYIGGTFSQTKNTTLFTSLAASMGYHVIALSYPNDVAIQTACTASSDPDCHLKFRQEVCFGTPLSSAVSVDSLNSLNTRAVNLLMYLNAQFPAEGWDQFSSGNQLQWSSIVTSGHSQGAGHALFLANVHIVSRCIMFSGANDFSNFYGSPASWINNGLTTPLRDIRSFLHLRDDGVPFSTQYSILSSLGLTLTDDTTLVDNNSPPFNNSNLLYTNAEPAISAISPYHNATVIDQWTPKDPGNLPVFLPVWQYLLDLSPITNIPFGEQQEMYSLYPNPAGPRSAVRIRGLSLPNYVSIYDCSGKRLLNKAMNLDSDLEITIDFPPGVYFVKTANTALPLIVTNE
jgi:hypothetical protein